MKRRRAGCVLVVGAAHIDVIADYAAASGGRLDKAGTVRYSIGGTGYNVAVDLGQDGVEVALVCVVKRDSFSAVWTRERLKAANVDARWVETSAAVPESGFVGIRRDGQLETAVTASAIEQHTFNAERLQRAVAAAKLVVVDCNLDAVQLKSVIALAQRLRRPVVVACVSDAKVRRLQQQSPAEPVDLVALNDVEARAAGLVLDDVPTAAQAQAACAALRARMAIVTRGERGHVALADDGGVRCYAAPANVVVASTSGAGDALLAGVVGHWWRSGRLDVDAAHDHAMLLVAKTLALPAATAGALAVDADFAQLARIAVSAVPWWRRGLSTEVGVAATLVATLIAAWQFAGPRPATGSAAAASAAPAAETAASIGASRAATAAASVAGSAVAGSSAVADRAAASPPLRDASAGSAPPSAATTRPEALPPR